jgi:hypothetical protein
MFKCSGKHGQEERRNNLDKTTKLKKGRRRRIRLQKRKEPRMNTDGHGLGCGGQDDKAEGKGTEGN